LLIDSKGGAGKVASFSVLDYTGGETPVEVACAQTNVNIPTGTTTLKVTRTLQPLMTLTPNGGETLERGRMYTITWYDRLEENVKIELLKGSTAASTIASTANSNGVFEWSIPADLPTGSDYKIKISSISDASVSDASDSAFSVKEKTTLNLTSPVGGEYIEKGKAFPITWNTDMTGDVVIDLYKDRMSETSIISSVKAAGPFCHDPERQFLYNPGGQQNEPARGVRRKQAFFHHYKYYPQGAGHAELRRLELKGLDHAS
jgi:hypothetical protein